RRDQQSGREDFTDLSVTCKRHSQRAAPPGRIFGCGDRHIAVAWVKLKLPGHDPSMERGRLHKQRRLRNAVLKYPMESDGRQVNGPAGRSFFATYWTVPPTLPFPLRRSTAFMPHVPAGSCG